LAKISLALFGFLGRYRHNQYYTYYAKHQKARPHHGSKGIPKHPTTLARQTCSTLQYVVLGTRQAQCTGVAIGALIVGGIEHGGSRDMQQTAGVALADGATPFSGNALGGVTFVPLLAVAKRGGIGTGPPVPVLRDQFMEENPVPS